MKINKLIPYWKNASAPAWTPASLTPLIWLNSTAATMASDGASWTDTMGNYSFTGGGGGNNPAYNATALNGRPGFDFTVSDVMNSARITQIQNIQALTIWMVGKRSVLSHADAGATNLTVLQHNAGDDTFYAIIGGGIVYGSIAKTNAFYYSILQFNGAATGNSNRLQLDVNGVLQTLSFTGTIPAQTENSGTSIGRLGSNSLASISGTACEFGVKAALLSAGEKTSLNTYLATTYAL